MPDAQDADGRMGEIAHLSEAQGFAGAAALDKLTSAAVLVGLREGYAELLKEPVPKHLTDLAFRLHQAQEPKSNWTFDRSRGCYERGNRRVHPLERGGFLVSEDDTWLPGAYDSMEAAVAAFDLSGEALLTLRDLAIAEQRDITLAEIYAAAAIARGMTPRRRFRLWRRSGAIA